MIKLQLGTQEHSEPLDHEILKYYQSTGKAHVTVSQILLVPGLQVLSIGPQFK